MKILRDSLLCGVLLLAFVPAACIAKVDQQIHLQACQVGNFSARCGTFSVFEDRVEQSGRKIDLRLAIIPARSDHPAPDAVFVLAGGPGASALEWTNYYMQLLGTAREQRDVVFVDQRGTGGSNKMECPQSLDTDRQAEELRDCMTGLNGDPRAYTTAWAMDDLDDVRAALGYDQINLYGGSYGGMAIQVYLLRHGKHVRTAAADGTTLLEVPILERWPLTSQKALEQMFVRCDSDASCHSAFPNLRQEFAAVLARLEREPVTLSITNPATGQPTVVTAELFRTSIHGALTSTPTAVFIPRYIHLVYTEQWSELIKLLGPFLNADDSSPTWNIMNLTILCFEDWAKLRPAETIRMSAESYLQYSDVRLLSVPENICAMMPQPKAEALYGPLKRSTVPVLFFNGAADPQDPPENMAGSEKRYPNSLVIGVPGQAHGFTGIPCRAAIVGDFIEKGTLDGLDTSCLKEVPLPDFIIR